MGTYLNIIKAFMTSSWGSNPIRIRNETEMFTILILFHCSTWEIN